MTTKRITLLLLSLLLLFFLLFSLNKFSRKSNIELIIEKINEDYKGVVLDKFAPRDTKPTHLKIKTLDSQFNICPNKEVVKQATIGDSIIKIKDENYVYLIKNDGTKYRFFYTKISNETRNSKFFPKEWKNMWLESTKWDDK
ncbi:hypothetical protein [Winogradskyella luteola]|uniref:Uncharacterized protein n=1 Tax=Winogradskyella luteola TaxID=2828330 RepID=A0A9X1FB16_9FLAO|nr:hypothetical protein [Winogradskyella luteola]MBV7270739.1 hypothetical protein [Winogradskyella luteola]